MTAIWKEVSEKIKRNYIHFSDDFSAHPKKYFIRLLFVLLASLIITVVMFVFPQKIREEQVSSLVYADIDSPKLRPLNINEAQETITESKAISVLFSVPNGENYQELMKIFHNSQKMDELNRSIYFYPLVYNVEELEQIYNIKQEQMTVVFFKDGKEANRLTIEKKQALNFSEELIPELNRLPLANIKKLANKLANNVTSDSMETDPEISENSHQTVLEK